MGAVLGIRRFVRFALAAVFAVPLGACLCLAVSVLGLRWLDFNWMLALLAGWLVFGIALFLLRAISTAELRRLL